MDRLRHLVLLSVAVSLRQQIGTLLFQLASVDSLGTMLTDVVRVLHRQIRLHQERDNLSVDLQNHLLEEVKRLKFIDKQRVFLLVLRVLHRLFQVVEFAQMLFPSVVNHAEGDALLERQRNLTSTVLHRLFDVHHHVHAFLAIGERDEDIFVTRLILINLLDERQRLLAYNLRFLVVRLDSFLKQLVSEVVELAVFELFFIKRNLDTHV